MKPIKHFRKKPKIMEENQNANFGRKPKTLAGNQNNFGMKLKLSRGSQTFWKETSTVCQ